VLAVLLVAANPAVASVASRTLGGINHAREEHGLPALSGSRSLGQSARRYAGFMLRHQYFGHLARIHASSRFKWLGEALALDPGASARSGWVVSAWLHSPEHRAILLGRRYRYAGIAAAKGSFDGSPVVVWVLHVGR
jgi:uncharacterized protein YkwD